MEPFESPKLLLSRARSHIDEFKAAEKWFREKQPYRQFTEEDPQSGEILFKAKIIHPMPITLPVILFDIVNCLRSSLDHAVFDSSGILGGNPNPKYTKFPFGKTQAQASDDLERKNSKVPAILRPFLLSFKPFDPQNGGNEALFGLNELRNGKIHRTLTEMAVANSNIGLGMGRITSLHIESLRSHWDRDKRELTYMTATEAHMSIDIHISIYIAFDEGTAFAGSEAITTLDELHSIVSGIVSGIEAETTRLLGS